VRSLTALHQHLPRVPDPVERGAALAAAEGVAVELGGAPILHDVSIAARAGEVLALVGPNGAGKSTLLSVLTGDVHPHAGEVTLHGRPLAAWSAVEAAMRRAVLLQSVALSFPFTCAEVVEMGRAPWGRTPFEDDDEAAIAEAMVRTDVVALAGRRFGTLSGGEQARVSLARVLAQRTALVLLDEPTAALDLHHQELVLALAREDARAGGGVVVVLHDLNLAAAYADRVAVLDHGRLRAVGAPREVLTGELLSDVYSHAVDVFDHPRTGAPVILARR
jgi:iron complex transport system ATP-binding protein